MLYAVIFFYSPVLVSPLPEGAKLKLLQIVAISTFLFPVLIIYLFYMAGLVKSIEMQDQQDRFYPLLLTTFVYAAVTYVFFKQLNPFNAMALIIGSITVACGIVTVINQYWKISAHSVGISGVVGSLLAIHYKFRDTELFFPLMIAILIAGALMTARLSLNAHTPSQVLGGFLLGLTISIVSVYWFA